MKKLIIKEEQLKLIENLILENKVKQVLSNVESGDIILIFREGNNKPSKFEVMNKLPDGIFMRVADANSKDRDNLIQFSVSDLTSNTLNLRFTNRPEGEDNPEQINWKNMTLKDVSSITVLDDAKNPKGTAKLNGEDEEGEEEEVQDVDGDGDIDSDDQKYYKESLDSLISDLNTLSKGVQYVFRLSDKSEVFFTVNDKDSNSLHLALDKTEGSGEAERYDELIGDKLIFTPDSSTVKPMTTKPDENGESKFMFDATITRITKDNKGEEAEDTVTLKNIVDFDESDPISKMSDEEVLRTILSKPEVRSAFMKQPSLWDLITKKEPAGIFKAKNIFRQVFDDKKRETLNDLFKMHQTVKFELMDNYFYKEVDGAKYTLNLGKKYTAKVIDKGRKGVLLKVGPLIVRVYRLKNRQDNIYRSVVIIPQKDKDDITDQRTIKIYKQV